MNEADQQVLLAQCDYVLTTTLAELRRITSRVTPVRSGLAEGSPDHAHLSVALTTLHNTHAFLLNQLQWLNALPNSAAAAERNAEAQTSVSSVAPIEASADSETRPLQPTDDILH